MELITTPDIEQLTIDWLGLVLPLVYGQAVPVGTRIPNPRPVRSVILFRTGGAMQTIVSDRPTVTVECRSDIESDAARLMGCVDALLRAAGRDGAMWGGHQVYSVSAASVANLPDPITNQARYTASYQIHVRASVSTI